MGIGDLEWMGHLERTDLWARLYDSAPEEADEVAATKQGLHDFGGVWVLIFTRRDLKN